METGSEVFLDVSSGSETEGGVDGGRAEESTRLLLDPRRSTDCERTEVENMYDRGTIMISDWLRFFQRCFLECAASGLGGRRRKCHCGER